MGSTGTNINNKITRNTFSDNTIFDIERSQSTVGKTFSSQASLVETINAMDNGRYDVLDSQGNEFGGSVMYTDGMASDGMAYELHYRANYTQSGQRDGIQIDKFKQYEEGEW